MDVRFSFVGLGVLVLTLGCGGEAVSNPPPEDPSSLAQTNSTKSTDVSPLATTADVNKPTNDAPESPKADVATTNTTSEKPANDKPDADKPDADKPAATTSPADIPGANVTIGRLEADGLVTKDIQCKSEGSGGGFGLLGMVLVTAWMSPQKKALDACAPGGSEKETRVVWKAKGGRLEQVEAKGDAKTKACVEKALRPGKPVFEGHCAATVVHGKK